MSQNDTIDDHAAQLVIFFTIGEKRKYLPSPSALEHLIPKARREKAVATVLVICMLGYNICNELAPCVFVFM